MANSLPASSRSFPIRRTAALLYRGGNGLLLAICLVFFLRTFVLLGLVQPVVLHGSSMAPTLLGPHATVVCPACQWEFAVGLDQLPGERPFRCPDCRVSFFEPAPSPPQPGARVLIDRTRGLARQPQRWEVLIFRSPKQPTQWSIKRVLGLPGEQLAFRQGDLLVDGQLIRKSLAEQLAIRQHVHLEREQFRTWHPSSDHWQWHGGRWQHHGNALHELRFAPPGKMPVTDDLGVNQAASRQLNVATDLMVSCNLDLAAGSQVTWHAYFPQTNCRASWPPEGSSQHRQQVCCVWSLVDQQALLAIDGQVISRESVLQPWGGPPQLHVSATGNVLVSELSVWRDVYYHGRPSDRWPQPNQPLGNGEFFVVGDNVAISDDSRSWHHQGLTEQLMIGTPVPIRSAPRDSFPSIHLDSARRSE